MLIVVAQEPAGMRFKLRIAIGQKLEVQVSQLEASSHDAVDVAEQVVGLKAPEVVALVEVFSHEAEPDEVLDQ